MWPESLEKQAPLRTGLSTGSCATACSVACANAFFSGDLFQTVSITLPKGKTVELTIESIAINDHLYCASTIKDAGDDPDVTHGARVSASLLPIEQPIIHFVAGKGVGTVTRTGLALAVGEPAINPVPRKMIIDHLQALAKEYDYQGGFEVTISVDGGETLALKTMNPKLGIIGGISILGTSGIVRPFSCAAFIASIQQAIDVARANGLNHVIANTGNTSEGYAQSRFNLDSMAMIEMGDFVGALLKHLKKTPVPLVTLCGGFGKISKLAQGHMDLHSRASSIDLSFLAKQAASLGASHKVVDEIATANTSIAAYQLAENAGVDLGQMICRQAYAFCKEKTQHKIQIAVIAINRQGKAIGEYGDGACL